MQNVTAPESALRMKTTCIGGTPRSTVFATMFWNARIAVPQNITASPLGRRERKAPGDRNPEAPDVGVDVDAVAPSSRGARALGVPNKPASSSSSSSSTSAVHERLASPLITPPFSPGRLRGISRSSTSPPPHVAPTQAISDVIVRERRKARNTRSKTKRAICNLRQIATCHFHRTPSFYWLRQARFVKISSVPKAFRSITSRPHTHTRSPRREVPFTSQWPP